MYLAFLVYSLSSVFAKIASRQPFLSMAFLGGVFLVVLCSFIYALLWQKVLEKQEISVAVANKVVVLVLNLIWAFVLFDERLSLIDIVGIIVIFAGVYLISGAKNE